MTVIYDKQLDTAIVSLRYILLESLYELDPYNAVWEVAVRREDLNFQFECKSSNSSEKRKTPSLDFTMAKSQKEWRKLLKQQAYQIIQAVYHI